MMSLQSKTLTIIGGTVVVLVAVLYAAARIVLLDNFRKLEERDTRQNIERALRRIHDDISILDDSCRGSANWDKAYAFVSE